MWPLPGPALAEALPDGVAIVIDLLRASTTIVWALEAGAASIRPVVGVDEARSLRDQAAGHQRPLLAGERAGLPPEGFDLGNSPREHTPQRVAGRNVIFTTSNGTRAIDAARTAHTVLIGALANLTPTAEFAARLERPIHIVCAGTADRTTEDDVLGAGAFVAALATLGVPHLGQDADDALHHWSRAADSPESLLHALRTSRGGRNLIAIDLDHDVADAARIDTTSLVARLDHRTGLIVRA